MSRLFSPRTFSLAFAVAYVVAVTVNLPLFRYYPLVGRFSLTDLAVRTLGPAMSWYGWIASAGLVAGVASAIVPRRWDEKLWPGLFWLGPVAMLLAGFYREQEWFLR